MRFGAHLSTAEKNTNGLGSEECTALFAGRAVGIKGGNKMGDSIHEIRKHVCCLQIKTKCPGPRSGVYP